MSITVEKAQIIDEKAKLESIFLDKQAEPRNTTCESQLNTLEISSTILKKDHEIK